MHRPTLNLKLSYSNATRFQKQTYAHIEAALLDISRAFDKVSHKYQVI